MLLFSMALCIIAIAVIQPLNAVEKSMPLLLELTSEQYWKLSNEDRNKYQQVTQEYGPFGWDDRRCYGSYDTKLRTIYRLKEQYKLLAIFAK